MPPSVSLALVAVPCAAGLLWVFRKTSDQAAIRATRKRIQAHLMEFRLYGDEPALIWQTQKSLLRENIRYLRLMVRPLLLAAVPLAVLYFCLDGWYAKSPLPIGRDSVITVQLRGPVDPDALPPLLQVPTGIVIDAPAVRLIDRRQISWRIRPLQDTSGAVRIILPGESISRNIRAGQERSCALELPVRSHALKWVEIDYPRASVEFFGFEAPWSGYFAAAWIVAALLLKHWFRVAL